MHINRGKDATHPKRAGEAQALIVQAMTTHAPALLATAKRHSLCLDDAQDAYQRAVEILLRRADSLDPARAINWLHTVVKHEAMAVRRSRQEIVDSREHDLDLQVAPGETSPEEQVLSWEHTARAAEALKRLKPQEIRALWLKASGLSYAEIAERESWTYTKVNRCLAEGRKSFLDRYAGIESGAECERWALLLSALVDGEATPGQLAEVRPHLRNCPACRATVRELHSAGPSIAVLFPAGALMADPSESLLARIWDTIIVHVSDRANALALKAQVTGEAMSGAKAAAFAASAVTVAGGGAVVVEATKPDARPTSEFRAVSAVQPVHVSRDLAVRINRAETSKPPPRRGEFERVLSKGEDPAQVDAEFGLEPSFSARPRPKRPQTASVQSGTEFDP